MSGYAYTAGGRSLSSISVKGRRMMELKNNLQLKSALDDYLYILTVDLPPENTLATTMVFSARFSRRMDRLIRAARKLEAKNSSANQPHKSRSGEPMSDQPARRWRK